jgi:hypothetical protein
MSIIQTGTGTDGRGITSIVYSCNRCESLTNNPYASIGSVFFHDEDIDRSGVEGWSFDRGHSYCRGCTRAVEAARSLATD